MNPQGNRSIEDKRKVLTFLVMRFVRHLTVSVGFIVRNTKHDRPRLAVPRH